MPRCAQARPQANNAFETSFASELTNSSSGTPFIAARNPPWRQSALLLQQTQQIEKARESRIEALPAATARRVCYHLHIGQLQFEDCLAPEAPFLWYCPALPRASRARGGHRNPRRPQLHSHVCDQAPFEMAE